MGKSSDKNYTINESSTKLFYLGLVNSVPATMGIPLTQINRKLT